MVPGAAIWEPNAWVPRRSSSGKEAQQEQLAHEADRIHAEEAAERGEAPAKKRPWWKFWA